MLDWVNMAPPSLSFGVFLSVDEMSDKADITMLVTYYLANLSLQLRQISGNVTLYSGVEKSLERTYEFKGIDVMLSILGKTRGQQNSNHWVWTQTNLFAENFMQVNVSDVNKTNLIFTCVSELSESPAVTLVGLSRGVCIKHSPSYS